MDVDSPEVAGSNGLRNAVDTIAAPGDAFARLRVAPTWGWALLFVIVLYAVGSFLLTPALQHATQADWPRQIAANPRMQAMTPEQQQGALSFVLRIDRFAWIIAIVVAPLAMFVQSVVMLIFKALGKGDAPYRVLWAAAVNIGIPAIGLNALTAAAIALARGADSFNSPADLQTAVPSAALLVPASAVKLHAFAAGFNPFTIWSCGLTIAALIVAARTSRPWAWAGGILSLLVAAGLVSLAAR
jgi:hypothetical protein